jgi:hypothetical protein
MTNKSKIDIVTTPNFRKTARLLYEKYPSLKTELAQLEQQLSDNPMRGKSVGSGKNNFRVAIRKRGEHDGFSIMTRVYFKVEEQGHHAVVYLADIHDKVDLPAEVKTPKK